ncbi:MAG: FGGY-family carbohydrate kinase [Lachnospiraceae bacterium]|jgi:sugar (pentulose or hexulose) kinase|nr:FGGY-family carbohydrate kinase [Lachnospiraceae bacterium]
MTDVRKLIVSGGAVLGIEFGSTRIKGILINDKNEPIAEGSYEWENKLVDGVWTYDLETVWEGLRATYTSLAADVLQKYGVVIKKLAGIGISAMMHGYLAFDGENNLLVPFRTWRNTMTEQAAEELTELFNYNIPQRWSIAHLYQAILKDEPHVKDVRFFTTLAGYVHWMLTGEKVLGIGDASGMFPIDINTHDYDAKKIALFDEKIAGKGYPWKLEEILPKALLAGQDAGCLTAEGAAMLDETGNLEAGVPLCPPEGDAGTGMTATNSVARRTGNVSAGTSVFGMVVLEKELSKVYPEIDLVTTPCGDLVGMAHCNTCTSDLNAWVGLFAEFCGLMGIKADRGELFTKLYTKAMEGEADCGGLLGYNYLSGEAITHMEEGRPLFVRNADSRFTIANFMRMHLYSALSVLKIGCDLLLKEEHAALDTMYGHGGFFKTEGVGQNILAAALDVPVTVMSTAGEGGAWGVALLAAYRVRGNGAPLESWLKTDVFGEEAGKTVQPDPEAVAGFNAYLDRYVKGLPIERASVDCYKG